MKLTIIQYIAGIFFSAAITNNILFTRFLGICPAAGVGRDPKAATFMGLIVMALMTVSAPVNLLLYRFFLAKETSILHIDLSYLSFVVFMLVIAALVQLIEMIAEKMMPDSAGTLGIYLPLAAVNCAILGASLFLLEADMHPALSPVYGLGCGAGWLLAAWIFSALEMRLASSDVPESLKGGGMTLIAAGIMAVAFMGFSGITL
ncbi:MAG: NADH:ubiquinone reductase (Na(+)-transporting) subunit E [Spirochaetes bacterium]|nr:NADH:ubiquinone reductase (Na(+)-transporting) subunit E [Spirochaetota bacterium]